MELPPAQLQPITTLILDVDGVMTDGSIIYPSSGEEVKAFNVRDGSGLKYWTRSGGKSAIISGRTSPAVERRAEELGFNAVELLAKDKLPALQRVLAKLGVTPQECAYLGDDLPDLPPMRRVGLPLAVADAAPEVRAAAAAITLLPGGRGAVREVIEAILQAQGKWAAILARYEKDTGS